MKKRILLIGWFLLLFFIASGQRLYNKDFIEKYKLNYSPPMKKYRFSKLKDKSFPSFLDSNAVYIFQSYDDEDKDSVISFVRFYGNNICFSSHPYKSMPSDVEFSQTDYGSWEMYKIKGNKLIAEYYETLNVPPDFFYSYAIVKNDSILNQKIRLGRSFLVSSHKTEGVGTKRKMNFTDFTINWK